MNKIFKIIFIVCICFYSIPLFANIENQKIKVGLLIPMSGDNKELGQLLIKSTKMALQDIKSDNLEIFPKDTGSNPTQTLKSAYQLKQMGVKIVIGPVFLKI